MTENHPDPRLLERFMRGEADARERRVIIRHLLAGCPQCSAITSRLWAFGEERPEVCAPESRKKGREGRQRQQNDLALDSPAEAEVAFQEGMEKLLREGLGTEAARALLDLALLYTRQGRAGDVQRLAEGFYPICRVRGVDLKVVTSLLYFRRLVETGHATPEALFQISSLLDDPSRRSSRRWGEGSVVHSGG